MGLANFPSAAEGVLPVLLINTALSLALLRDGFRWLLLQVVGHRHDPPDWEIDPLTDEEITLPKPNERSRDRILVIQFQALCEKRSDNVERGSNGGGLFSSSSSEVECCVCLSGYKGDEEVSELLSCKHLFHKGCLQRWLDHMNTTCPLCRALL